MGKGNGCQLAVHVESVLNPRFGGVGFHVFDNLHPLSEREMHEVYAKRWREIRPSFARVTHNWKWSWPHATAFLRMMQQTADTEIYLTTWDPKDTQPGKERAAYGQQVAAMLERLITEEGISNIRYYCMTNELSLGKWGALLEDLPKFKDYHQAIFTALRERNLPVELLASDASPLCYWNTIEWATQQMDDISGAYGGHHYINDQHPADRDFYPWFLERMQWGAGLARGKGKPFIVGEFGAKQYDGPPRAGKRWDGCQYWDTKDEPLVGIQLAEAVIAMLNAGVYGLGYWTFADFPDEYRDDYANKWGIFRSTAGDHSTRAHYYAYGLLTKFFRGPAAVLATESSDALVRMAAVRHQETGSWSFALVNRHAAAVPITLSVPDADGQRLRKYVYDPAAIPSHPFGDLQEAELETLVLSGQVRDELPANSLVVYTSSFTTARPAPVQGVCTTVQKEGVQVCWQANAETDLSYYRIFRGDTPEFTPVVANQIGSTVATSFLDEGAAGIPYYRVLAVNQSGNTSKASQHNP